MFRLVALTIVLGILITFGTLGYLITKSIQHSQCVSVYYGCPNTNAYVVGIGLPLGIVLLILGTIAAGAWGDDEEDPNDE